MIEVEIYHDIYTNMFNVSIGEIMITCWNYGDGITVDSTMSVTGIICHTYICCTLEIICFTLGIICYRFSM